MQTLLEMVCQDKFVDLFFRLDALKILELRANNWSREEAGPVAGKGNENQDEQTYSRADLLTLLTGSLAREDAETWKKITKGIPSTMKKK